MSALGLVVAHMALTSNTGKQLTGELLNVAAGKRHKGVALEKVKHALAEQVRDNANVVAVVERISEVDALVAVALVIRGEGREYSQLDARSVAVLLDGADDLDCDLLSARAVVGLDNLAECALAEQFDDRIWNCQSATATGTMVVGLHRSVRSAF